jgi:hypothetical protein
MITTSGTSSGADRAPRAPAHDQHGDAATATARYTRPFGAEPTVVRRLIKPLGKGAYSLP